jgi:hypothetical protein
MRTLVRSLVAAVLFLFVAGAAPAAAQRVVVDIHVGTPGFHYRHYRHGHRVYRQYHRPYAWYRAPRGYYRRSVIVHRPLRVQRHRHYQWH